MYKLIRYEIRKIISSKFIMGLFAVLFLLNCYISWDSAKLYTDNTKAITNAYRAVLEDYDGVMEYIDELKAILREKQEKCV